MSLRLRWPWTHEPEGPPAPPGADGPAGLPDWDRAARLAAFAEYATQDYALSSGAVERYRTAATSTQTAAAALGVLYTGALALVFGEDQGGLPARGLLAPAFLAVSLAASTWYLSGSSPRSLALPRPPALDGTDVGTTTFAQLRAHRLRVTALVSVRLWALRVGAGALAVALFLAPAAFTQTPREQTLTPWPSVPAAAGDAELALYEAQVAEIADVRAKQRAARGEFWTPADYGWVAAAAGGLVALGAVGRRTARKSAQILADIEAAAAPA
ncbi:hypothetical protein [Actinotalea solisilvae]|uniref:hypothetical protein n=1 Tax=Actinotalea solisilvae TaxID=2072922 RepID=UPI0018F200D6|nr:hypothetical protein [Actinotalea solisilvae]